jgi:hypothetical protein
VDLNDLFATESIDPQKVFVLRHRPTEPKLVRVLPWLAATRPDIFNAYQRTQGPRLERSMEALIGSGLVASFIGLEAGRAVFAGLYSIRGAERRGPRASRRLPVYSELRSFGMRDWALEEAGEKLWFDLELEHFYSHWKGRLVVEWPPPERAWYRRAHKNRLPIYAIHEDSLFESRMPPWDQIELRWEELAVLPQAWKAALAQWRGIYFIFDESDHMGYVGSAYGKTNLLRRWLDYASTKDGGNRLLRDRDPRGFIFTILQRVSPDMEAEDVIRLETTWKKRLHTHAPVGLNAN